MEEIIHSMILDHNEELAKMQESFLENVKKQFERMNEKIKKKQEDFKNSLFVAMTNHAEKSISEFSAYVSKEEKIPLADMISHTTNYKNGKQNSNPVKSGYCQGITAQGKQCSRKAKTKGYCKTHQSQIPMKKVNSKEKLTIEMIEHNHEDVLVFKENCPFCKKTKEKQDQNEKALREMIGLVK